MWRETQQQRKRWKSRGKILGGNRKDERSTALLLELTWRSTPQWAPANKACARVLACVSTYTKPADHERAPISKRNLWQKNFFAGRIQRLGLAGDARGSRWHLKLLPLLASVSAHLATGDTITHHACTDAQSLERTRVRKKNLSRALSHQDMYGRGTCREFGSSCGVPRCWGRGLKRGGAVTSDRTESWGSIMSFVF